MVARLNTATLHLPKTFYKLELLQTKPKRSNYFPDLRLIIEDVAKRRIPKYLYRYLHLSLNQIFFIEALQKIYRLPMGRPVCDFLMNLPCKLGVYFCTNECNSYNPNIKLLCFNLLLPVYLVVEKNKKQHIEKSPRICIVYHELLHVMRAFSPIGLQSHISMDLWSNLEEYQTITGRFERDPFSENGLRRYLGFFPRAQHHGGLTRVLFKTPYEAIKGFLFYKAYGDLENYLKIAKPFFNEIYETNFIYLAVQYEQRVFAKILINYLLNDSDSKMSAEEFIEKVIEDRRFELLLVLHKLCYI